MKDAFRYGFIQCHEQFNIFPIIQCTPALIIHKTKGEIYFLLSCFILCVSADEELIRVK